MGTALQERIDRQREVKNRIDDVIHQISRCHSVGPLKSKCGDAFARLNNHIERYGADNALSPSQKDERTQLRATYNEAKQASNSAAQKDTALREELNDLKEELIMGSYPDTSKDFAKILADRDAIKADIEQLSEASARQTAKANSIKQKPSPLPPLLLKRQEALASKALGEDNAQEIEEINQQIEQAEAELAADKTAEAEATQAVAGLQSRISQKRKELVETNGYLSEGIFYQLAGRAIIEELEYAKLATALKEKMSRLLAFGQMISDYAPDTFPGSVSGDRYRKIYLPNFALPTGNSSMVEPLSFESLDVNAVINSLKEEFKRQGVEFQKKA